MGAAAFNTNNINIFLHENFTIIKNILKEMFHFIYLNIFPHSA